MFKTEEEEKAFQMGVHVGKIKELERQNGKPTEEFYWEDLTLGDVEKYSKTNHSDLTLDSTLQPFQRERTEKVWDGKSRVGVFWVKGDSEGYYVHLTRFGKDGFADLMYAKTWDVCSAEKIVRDISRFINDEWRD